MYNVAIIGAGPAGIFAALEVMKLKPEWKVVLIEKGQRIETRKCPLRQGSPKCVNCKKCGLLCGWGGAGAFSDGKLTLTPDVGGHLAEYMTRKQAEDLIGYADDLYLKYGVLEPCVWAHTYKLHKGRLNSNVAIRSNDMPLGNPFNVTQYSILLSLLARHGGFDPGEISFDIADCHIYVNQLDGINLQLSRYDRLVKWEKFIQTHNDEQVENSYEELLDRKKYLDEKINNNPDLKDSYSTIINDINEEIMCLEHLITRQRQLGSFLCLAKELARPLNSAACLELLL